MPALQFPWNPLRFCGNVDFHVSRTEAQRREMGLKGVLGGRVKLKRLTLLIGPAPYCHAGLQGCSRPALSLGV